VIWSAIGGADIYRGQAAPATAGVHGHDEFFADFAKQVPVPRQLYKSLPVYFIRNLIEGYK
jgi:hypothetical protein